MTATTAYTGSGLTSPVYTVTPALPTGLVIAAATGVITGTPTVGQAATTYTVTATGTGASVGVTTTATVSIAIAAGSMSPATQTVTATAGAAITATTAFTTNGLSGTTSYAVSPALPTGLTMSTTTGVITGTTTTVQVATTYTVTATGTNGFAYAKVTIAVALLAGQIQTQLATGGSIGSGTGWSLNGGGSLVWAKITAPAAWSVASAQCTALGTGWRMPTQGELSGLVNTASAKSAATAAGWTLSGTWSSSLSSAGNHYNVSLSNGNVNPYNDTYIYYVPCVL